MEPGNVDEIELIEQRKASAKSGNVRSKSRDSKLIEQGQKVDYVLVYEERNDLEGEELKKEEKRLEKRDYFESKLREKGLLLQHVDSDLNEEYNKIFVLIHAPWDVLAMCAEEMMIRAPVRKAEPRPPLTGISGLYKRMIDMMEIFKPLSFGQETKQRFVNAFFNQDKLESFLIDDKETFFNDIDRTRMVNRILHCAHFSAKGHDFGIDRLLYEGAYQAGYTLHEGNCEVPPDVSSASPRQGLRYSWASFGQWFRFQPLNAIKEYFGVRVALYFAWLGLYNFSLIGASIVGLICFFVGLGSMNSFIPAQEICNKSNERLFYMCPLCDVDCSYWTLGRSCKYARLTHLFDHDGTVFFAAFMSLWATIFLEVWKRKQISLAFDWDMMNYEDEFEPVRPSYVAAVKEKRRNPVNGQMEPYIPYSTQLIRKTCSLAVVVFMVLLVVAAVAGVVIYRAAVSAALYAFPREDVRRGARIITSVTASCINLAAITILSFVYEKIAVWLTNWENPRTTSEYSDGLTFKMFLFQSVNMYSSLFYIAFFKGSMIVGVPGRYNRIAGGRMEGCDPSGCLIELCIQLAIILVGKQIISLFFKFIVPCALKWWHRRAQKDLLENDELDQWERDYLLNPEPEFRMFYEYHDIVIQFGFVTMFVAAFPLAPFFALLNNILELRIDAINFVVNFRRPVAERAQDIGSWLGILQIMSKIAVIVNSFVIAFTSEFIPRIVYQYGYSPDGSLKGYVNNSLSYFNVKDFEPQSVPLDTFQHLSFNNSFCRYKEYFEPQYPYRYDRQFYYVLAVRLAFVIIFQYLVFFTVQFLDWLIPDVPYHLDVSIKREAFIAKKCMTKSEITATKEYDEVSENSMYESCESLARNRGKKGVVYSEHEV
ncbi:anoctamin-4-like [Actinia tenebrosa]|uniref:Anoctamin n=1 Tax=Actinia tenebrosa TaxID=6105 RepID=A0A6P8IDV7_ACTTE|nr:anoctamin-4-like [Actinia tenebrosa]XP_031563793.1 anoctamin-4-like [Actinia tenebrosa]XP_031563794.1 anoctamin-4-like [Actinia tenebrosa]XP_031563795.1 anoctamin-4-like [Actinia tenebrosa]